MAAEPHPPGELIGAVDKICFRCVVILVVLALAGCAGPTRVPPSVARERETVSALGSVAGALTNGQKLNDEELRRVAQDLRRDPQSQQAVTTVTRAVSRLGVTVKYCPVDGQRFSADLKICPVHGVTLKDVEEP